MRTPRLSISYLQRSARATVAVLLLGALGWVHAADPKASRYFEEAMSRYDKNDVKGAIIELKNALQIDPTMLPAHMLLGKALLRNSEVIAAEVALQEALRLGVSREEVVVPLAQVYLALGKHKQIVEGQQFLLAGLPPYVRFQLLLLRASAASDLGKDGDAMKAIEEARTIDPKAPEAWLAEVPVRIRTRQFKEAMAAAERALALAPDSAEARYQRSSILHVQGDLKGALAGYDRAIAASPEHVESLVAQAGLLIDLNRPKDAAKDLDTLKKAAPAEPRAEYLRALLAERDNDAASAKASMKALTELIDPLPLDAIRYRSQLMMLNGLAHYGLGQREKAKQYLELFNRVHNNSPVSKLLARILLEEPNVPRAIDVLEAYLRNNPTDAQAITMLASAYMRLGKHAKATALMQDALKARDTPEMRTVLGMSMLRGEQPAEGLNELEAIFKKDPDQIHAGLALVTTYMRSGQGPKAVGIAERLVKQSPKNASFYNLLGMAQGMTGNGSAAKVAFEQALKLDDSLVASRINLARLEIATKAYDAAATRLGNILQADGKNAEAMFEMAALSEQRGNLKEAQRWLEKANDQSGPKETRWGLAMLEFFLRTGQTDLALNAAKSVSGKAPNDVQVLLAYSRAQMAVGDRISARSALNTATRMAEYDSAKQVEIALLQLSANNMDGAVYNLDKALASEPGYLPALAMQADIDLRKNDVTSAEKRAREILATHPQRAIGYSLLGDVARARGQSAAALDNYRLAHQKEPSTDTLLRLFAASFAQQGAKTAVPLAEQWLKARPQDIAVRRAMGDAFARSGDYALARANYESVIKHSPDDTGTLNNLANVLLRLKDPAAVKVAELALEKDPSNPNTIDTLGWILLQNGKTDRALTMLRDARLREPANPVIRYHLAVALAQTGRKTEARDELETALRGGAKFEFSGEAQALMRTLK